MKYPDKPENEQTRLDTLRSLKILDTNPEERYDRLTRLARRLFDVPIALISLIDAERQWFKSALGLNTLQTSRDVSFCAHAILDEDIMTVPDAKLDERFHDNPLVTGSPNIRFYVGCPLVVSNGIKLGTLCLIDQQPRIFNEEDRALLRDLAHMVEQEIAAILLATLDELTLLSNRRGFEALAQQAINVCNRLNKPASLLFFDLDQLKQINDRYGHAEGDHALTVFSRLLTDIFRESDVIGRLGGDEFVALLTNSDQSESAEVVERLQQAVAHYNEQAGRDYELSFSVGAVEYQPMKHMTIAALLADADNCMYEQKKKRSRLNA